MRKQSVKLADALYDEYFADAERIAMKLPAGWQHKTMTIVVKHPGYSRYAHSPNTIRNDLTLSKYRLGPSPHHTLTVELSETTAIFKLFDDHSKQCLALEKERKELREKLHRLLYACYTDKQLVDAWPEAKKYIPDYVPKDKGLVPVHLVKEIDKIVHASVAQ